MENNEKITLDPQNTEAIANHIVDVLDSRKGRDIKMIRVEERTSIADYFVICSATSSTQMRALVDEVEYQLGECGIKTSHIEGRDSGWMVIDFLSVVVHVFTLEAREFYNLERLYTDGAEKAPAETIEL